MRGKLSSKVKKSFQTIETVSIRLLIESYNLALVDKKYDLDWEEEQFSAFLLSIMNKLDITKKYYLHIDIEKKLLNEDELPIGANNPKKLPRIDLNIESWLFKDGEKLKYFFEAKNLCENDWNKKSGLKATVVASKHQKRYIETGIENFRIGRYYDGALVGYVLEGKLLPIIDKLNIRLSKNINTINKLNSLSPPANFKDIYSSTHLTPLGDKLNIKHIFLKFV